MNGITSVLDDKLRQLRLFCRNAPYLFFGAPDGLPIPPLKLRALIWGPNADLRTFFRGRDDWKRIPDLLTLLRRNGVRLEKLQAILDFGCGCGRDLRQFYRLDSALTARLYGTDINQEQIDWCARNLKFAEFCVNPPDPPLMYAVEQFDLIYNYSVFTHLSEVQQEAWIMELERVLKPGGHLMLTVCGESYIHELTESQKAQFRSGRLVVRHEELSGKPSEYGACAAYHPARFVKENLAAAFEIVNFIPGQTSIPGSMDQYLLKKPAARP